MTVEAPELPWTPLHVIPQYLGVGRSQRFLAPLTFPEEILSHP